MKKLILVGVITFLLLPSSVMAYLDYCKGDFTFDGDVDGDDLTVFLNHFGRGQYSNPCPQDGQAPVQQTGGLYGVGISGEDRYAACGVREYYSPTMRSNYDGTVTDKLTGLIWTEEASLPPKQTWTSAVTYCWDLFYAGYQDWRLPNRKELLSIIDLYHPTDSVRSSPQFIDIKTDDYYWTSTPFAPDNNNYAWGVSLLDAWVPILSKTDNNWVWCVRGGNCFNYDD